MSCFLDSISTIISVFHQLTEEDGGCSNLSRRKMKEFIQREFADAIANPHDPQTIDKILQFLEWDGDGEIDFNEFLLLACRVAKACYWYQPKEPCLLQRTKLASGRPLREPEIQNRGSHRQLQEEERQTCESYHHPPCEQRDIMVQELETQRETGSCHQQRNDAKRSREPGEPIPQVHEEQNQESCEQRNSQRRRQALEPSRRGDARVCSQQTHQPWPQEEERQHQEGPQPELADVRTRSQTCEPQPLPNRWSRCQPRGPAQPASDKTPQQPQEADRSRQHQPRKPELVREERSRYDLRELEQKALEESSQWPREPEYLDSRCPHQSHLQEPLDLDHRYYETGEQERDLYEGNQQERETEFPEKERYIQQAQDKEERDNVRKEEPVRERRIDHQRELDVEVYERHSRQTRERRDGETDEPVTYERRRETTVVAAEADLKIHRVSREQEPRGDMG
ncbi:PREDICTED: trichohyalin-like, partial [Mesitornis unicolor]|uniref:trichohyalin-like n=1 Tax=Mesitornis unicolor TaxID=54374 RepID=UPI000528EA56